MKQIIDFHAHAFPDQVAAKAKAFLENYYHLPMEGDGTLGQLLSFAHKADIAHLVVCSTATTPKQVQNINDWLAKLQKENPFITALGTLHPDYPDIQAEADRIIALGLHGVKLHPDFQHTAIDDERMQRIYQACQGRLPILIHTGDKNTEYSKPRKLAAMLEKYPNQVFIAAHMGGYSDWNEAKECLVGKNVYFDTSSTFCGLSYQEVTRIIRAHGVDKVLFGTDYPMAAQETELERFMHLDLTEEEKHKILYENARKLLNLQA